MMSVEEIYKSFLEYNDDEIFYKKLFLSKQNPKEYEKFLKSLNSEFLNSRKLIVPEIKGSFYISHFDDSFFNAEKHRNVYILKHNRYTPPYEHDHDFFEILYVLSGKCKNTIYGKSDTLTQGDLCIMSPSVKHSIWTEDGLIINILIRRKIIQTVFLNIFQKKGIISEFFTDSIYFKNFASSLVFHTNGNKKIQQQILEMYEEQQNIDDYSEGIISNMLMIFFNILARNYTNTAEYPKNIKKKNESATKIISLITENFSTISLFDIADELGYSEVYCSRYIKKITGFTFSELKEEIRLEKAKDLLTNSTLTIGEISFICGYENPENFNRMFRNKNKISPSLFRKQNS